MLVISNIIFIMVNSQFSRQHWPVKCGLQLRGLEKYDYEIEWDGVSRKQCFEVHALKNMLGKLIRCVCITLMGIQVQAHNRWWHSIYMRCRDVKTINVIGKIL